MSGFFSEEELEAKQEAFSDDLSKLSKDRQAQVKSMQSEIQRNLDMLNAQFFSDDTFERENKLREWVRELTNNLSANITDAEEILGWVKRAAPLQTFSIKGAALIKTSTGRLDRVDRYTAILEKTVLDQHNQIKDFTKLSFFSLIKIAIRRIFKRSK